MMLCGAVGPECCDQVSDVFWRQRFRCCRLASELGDKVVTGAHQNLANALREPVIAHEAQDWPHGFRRESWDQT